MKKLLCLFTVLVFMVMPMLASADSYDNRYLRATDGISVFEFPGYNSQLIGSLEDGDYIYAKNYIYTMDGRTWIQIEYNGWDGYVSSNSFSYVDESIRPIKIPLITTGSMNIHVAPDINSYSNNTISTGVTVEVSTFFPSEDGRVWAEIEHNGSYGYISMRYLKPLYDSIPDLGVYMRVTGGSVNAHAFPAINSEVLGIVHQDDVLRAYYYTYASDGRIWAYCRTLSGEDVGYVSMKYLVRN